MSMLRHVLILCFVLMKTCLSFHVNPRPTLSITNNSLEAISIANKINQFFESNDAKNEQNNGLSDLQVQPKDLGKSMIKLNLNLNVEIENGKPTPMTLPQGDLILMYVPEQNEITEQQLESFMQSTNGPTTTNKVNGGTLFTSWLAKSNQGAIMGRSDSLPSSISNDQDLSTQDVIDAVHDKIVQDPLIRQRWNQGQIPKFPNYHNYPGMFKQQAAVKVDTHPKDEMLKQKTDDLEQLLKDIDPKEQMLKQKTDELEQLLQDLKKKYRIEDEFSHQNMNSVVAGELTRPVGHMSSTVECSEINGETVCKRRKQACSNSFGIGCQMNSLVPFSQPQGSMSMRTTTTRIPQFLQRRTTRRTTTTTQPPATTTTLSLRDIEEQRLVDEVMQMDAHSIADAFTDPMMMALGGLITMAGAYMAIVMQEQAAASAFAVAAASGKKKK